MPEVPVSVGLEANDITVWRQVHKSGRLLAASNFVTDAAKVQLLPCRRSCAQRGIRKKDTGRVEMAVSLEE